MFTQMLGSCLHLMAGSMPARLRAPGAMPGRLQQFSRRGLAAVALSIALAGAAPVWAQSIAIEKLDLAQARTDGKAGVQILPVLSGEIKEVSVDLVSIVGPGRHVEPARSKQAVVWLILAGKGTLQTQGRSFDVEGETIARAPQAWAWQINAAKGEALHVLRVRRDLTADDFAQLKKFPQNNAAPHVKKFSECPAYGEAIKSAKTVSRTLLPENFVPRMAMGTVETTGPDTVGAHRHPMLEQLFLGLQGNDITVIADQVRANLTGFSILHIPLGSNHGAEVASGNKLHYVWMDFFMSKEGQEWLKMHKPLEPQRKQ